MVTSLRNGVPPEEPKPREIPPVVIEAKDPEPEPEVPEHQRRRAQHPQSHHGHRR